MLKFSELTHPRTRLAWNSADEVEHLVSEIAFGGGVHSASDKVIIGNWATGKVKSHPVPSWQKGEIGKITWKGHMEPTEMTTQESDHQWDHWDNLDHFHRDHVRSYKESSGINVKLRGGSREGGSLRLKPLIHPDYTENDKREDHALQSNRISHLDRVTSLHTLTPMTVYRGVTRQSTLHLKHPGEEFIDHGYTGTSLDPETAAGFSGEHHGGPLHGHQIVARIHMPAGTKGHYLEVSHKIRDEFGEREFLLHRGTRFKVMQHSIIPPRGGLFGGGNPIHVIHMRVTGQHPKNILPYEASK